MRFDYPFLLNNTRTDTEAKTFIDIMTEAIYLNGQDLYYIERDLLNQISGFGEFKTKVIKEARALRAYVEELEGFGGPGNMYSKFGLQFQDEITVYATKELFKHFEIIPKEQDLIYYISNDRLFEITYVADSNIPGVNYPFGNNYAYKLECKLYTFDYNDLSVPEVDKTDYDGITDMPDIDKVLELNELDIKQNNEPIESDADNIIDNTEKNPILGDD